MFVPPKKNTPRSSSEDISSSTSEDLDALYQSAIRGYKAEVAILKQRLKWAELTLEEVHAALDEVRAEFAGAHVESTWLSNVLQEREDYIYDIISAMEEMSSANAAADDMPSMVPERSSSSAVL